jgi:hypothetical protein
MKLAILAVLCAPSLAMANSKVPDPMPRFDVVVDAPVHETPVKKPTEDNTDHTGDDANLEARDFRKGFFLHMGLGPSITIGGGTGTGAGATLMFGSVMRPTWVALLAITANGQRHEVMDKIHINDYTSIGLGLQWWPSNGAVHARGTLGIGGYRCKQCQNPDEPTDPVVIDYDRRGVNATFAVGVDILRIKSAVVWGLDVSAILTVHGEPGVITALGFQSYLSFD